MKKNYIIVFFEIDDDYHAIDYFENEKEFIESVNIKKKRDNCNIIAMGEFKEIEIEPVEVVTKYIIKK